VLRLGPDDRILWVLPLAYHFAVTIVAYVGAGAHILMCPDTRPAAMLDAIHRFRPTVLYASPLHFDRLGRLESRGRLESVRVALSTSAPLPPAVQERFESRHGVPLGQAYGIIEAGLPCINPGGAGGADSLGRPVPGYEVTLLPESGSQQAADSTGEIAVRGPGLFSAYYRPWRRRDDLLIGGWFPTGDLGWLDQDGALHLSGRKKAVIFVAGLKVFPEEVETCIDRFPGVAESRVFARPHERLGEVPCAEIVVEPGGCDLADLASHCARALSAHKVPVEFTPVGAIARTSGGKVLRRLATGAGR
jgi:long-chain acyl-CoA synthetase